MINRPRVAIVSRGWPEGNLCLLRSLAKFKRFNANWHVFIDELSRGAQDPDWLLAQNWDGIICKEDSTELFNKAREMGIACVDLSDDESIREGCPKIRPNNVAVGHTGAEHFIEKGFRYFAFCGFGNELWSCDRRDGFLEGLALTGKTCETFESNYPGSNQPAWEHSQEDVMAKWLETLPKPIAIFACNDLRAVHLVNACHNVGYRVPEEVAILGVNNESARCELCAPSVSSIPIDFQEYANVAGTTMERLLAGTKPEEIEPLRLIDPQEVVTRRSTSILAVEDATVASALDLIREEACNGITVKRVAETVHASRSLLEKKFRQYVGRSPQVEIRQAQVMKIKQMLTETDFSLAQIAEIAGFKHPEYMSVVFKRLTKTTPNAYRRKSKAIAPTI